MKKFIILIAAFACLSTAHADVIHDVETAGIPSAVPSYCRGVSSAGEKYTVKWKVGSERVRVSVSLLRGSSFRQDDKLVLIWETPRMSGDLDAQEIENGWFFKGKNTWKENSLFVKNFPEIASSLPATIELKLYGTTPLTGIVNNDIKFVCGVKY